MKHTASEVLDGFVKSDLAVINYKYKDTPQKLKFQRKSLKKALVKRMKKDSNFNRSVRDICKFGWDLAFRKQLLRRNFEGVFKKEYILRRVQ